MGATVLAAVQFDRLPEEEEEMQSFIEYCDLDNDGKLELPEVLWIVCEHRPPLPNAPMASKLRLRLKRVQSYLKRSVLRQFWYSKTSKLVDMHMRWIYPTLVLAFNLSMFLSVPGSI
ncbi:hypothetical protein CYMTET_45826 [Cymbomonas tetramitiformis]|uniref:Uncharacterized protein n=1 Tax=Cymbomonas tetramitiformis TaxID=36881 RepID=A0AAE0BZ85_9CHLO|nr:hypothetical protein CYMTET_45826 [Cymbomonas tetramitiformis]